MSINNYAFTLRKTKLVDSHEPEMLRLHYEDRLESFRKLGLFVKDYEFETKHGLHVHGIIEIPISFYLKKLRMRGWNLDLKIIYDEEGWLSYIRKEKLKRTVEVVPLFKKYKEYLT